MIDRIRYKLAYWIFPQYFDDMEARLSGLLWHVTGGLLSKPNYTLRSMISAADDYQSRVCDTCDNCITKRMQKESDGCKVCERITDANKDIFWVFARTHQFEFKEEYHRVPVRFCPSCGREFAHKKEDGH